MTVKYSLVIPLNNEAENIVALVDEIEPVMKRIGEPWELICIDDGSTDSTLHLLKAMTKIKPHLRIIAFTKNFGQSSAFDAGFKAAKGDYVITMDGDRQNDPTDIPKLISHLEGVDMVCGKRAKRKDPPFKKIISRIANAIRSRLCNDGVSDTGCSLKIYRTECLKKIVMYQGMHRFLPALFAIEGFKVKEVDVNHRQRTHGKTKYNIFNRSLNTLSDLFAVRWMRKRKLNYEVKQKN